MQAWLAAGAQRRLTLRREDFAGMDFSLTALLFSGPLPQRLRQHWRSFCVYMGSFGPCTSWKSYWYRKAGVRIGKNVHFSPGVSLDMLFPQLITFEDGVVLGVEAMVMAHIYTPDRIVVGRATVKKEGLVGGRAILAAAVMGEQAVLASASCTSTAVPAGHTAIGVPAKIKTRNCTLAKDAGHAHSA